MPKQPLTLAVELLDGDKVIAHGTERIAKATPADEPVEYTVALDKLQGIELWDLTHPKLYLTRVTLQQGRVTLDQDTRRCGFREARFTPQGSSERQRHQAARAQPPPDVSLRGRRCPPASSAATP